MLNWFRRKDHARESSGAARRLADHVAAPSPEHPHQVDAIASLIARLDEDQWATFEARNPPGESVVIEVAGPPAYGINTCTEEIDLPAIARAIGLTAVADAITPGGERDDRTMHTAPGASAAELAELVNAIFRHHHRLPPEYVVEGRRQQ